jgi:hypothetical protein
MTNGRLLTVKRKRGKFNMTLKRKKAANWDIKKRPHFHMRMAV